MTILKRLVVVTGSYEKNGETKKRYKTIGHIHSASNGGEYITLAADVNLAAFPRRDGDDRVMVSMYDEEEKEAKPKSKQAPPDDEFGDSIPF